MCRYKRRNGGANLAEYGGRTGGRQFGRHRPLRDLSYSCIANMSLPTSIFLRNPLARKESEYISNIPLRLMPDLSTNSLTYIQSNLH